MLRSAGLWRALLHRSRSDWPVVVAAGVLLGRASPSPAAELSGGEQQRVALARALANKPSLLLAEEPTGQLDSDTGHMIMTLVRAIVRTEGITAIVATHDVMMLDVADRIVELRHGQFVAPTA